MTLLPKKVPDPCYRQILLRVFLLERSMYCNWLILLYFCSSRLLGKIPESSEICINTTKKIIS